MLRLYLAHPISGRSFAEIEAYYRQTLAPLQEQYDCFYPLIAAGALENESQFSAAGYTHPISTDHAILGRCRWMIDRSDVVLVDLTGAEKASIGCAMEIAFARAAGKHIIAVIPPDGPHRHAMILASVDVVFEEMDSALAYVDCLARRSVR